jgi:hypothetical protein
VTTPSGTHFLGSHCSTPHVESPVNPNIMEYTRVTAVVKREGSLTNPSELTPKDVFEVVQHDGVQTLTLRGDPPTELISLHQNEVEEMTTLVTEADTLPLRKFHKAVVREGRGIVVVAVKPRKMWKPSSHPFVIIVKSPKGPCFFEFTRHEMMEFIDLFDSDAKPF